jgi:hypothetical protein
VVGLNGSGRCFPLPFLLLLPPCPKYPFSPRFPFPFLSYPIFPLFPTHSPFSYRCPLSRIDSLAYSFVPTRPPARSLLFSSWFGFDSFLFPSFLSNVLSLTTSDLEKAIIANENYGGDTNGSLIANQENSRLFPSPSPYQKSFSFPIPIILPFFPW